MPWPRPRIRVGVWMQCGLLSGVEGLKLPIVYKNRLGARPPRKRSAPVAGKRIRNDETPPQAGFRVSGTLSGRGARRCSAEYVAQQRMETDTAFSRGRFFRVEYVR